MRSLIRIFRHARKAWLELLLAFFFLSGFAAINYRLPLLLRDLIDQSLVPSVTGAKTPVPALDFLPSAALLLLGLLLSGTFSGMILPYAKNKITRLLRNELFQKLFTLPLKTFDQMSGGDLMTRLTSDTAFVSNGIFSTTLVQLPRNIFGIITAFFGLYKLMGPLSLVFGLFILLFYLIGKSYARTVTPLITGLKQQMALLTHKITEDLRMHESLKFSAAVEQQLHDFDQANQDYVESFTRYAKIDWSYFMAIFGLNRIVPRLGIALLAFLALEGAPVTVGTIVAVADYLLLYLVALDNFVDVLPKILDSLASAARIHEILDLPDESQEGAGIKPTRGPIVFEHVGFSYLPEKAVLNDLSFSIQPGENVAIVGPTGSGKSTILQVLLRFRELDHGRILLQETDIATLHLKALRASFAMVQQDPAIFEGSLFENLALGKKNVSRKLAQAAMNAVLGQNETALILADDEVTEIQEKLSDLNFKVDARGKNLSAGEKQLIAFARALAQDPPILILDEATASVDPATERLLNHAVKTLQQGRTMLIVAHRLSTIQQCEKILVLNEGRVEDFGTHAELFQREGTYRQFVLDSLQEGKKAGNP